MTPNIDTTKFYAPDQHSGTWSVAADDMIIDNVPPPFADSTEIAFTSPLDGACTSQLYGSPETFAASRDPFPLPRLAMAPMAPVPLPMQLPPPIQHLTMTQPPIPPQVQAPMQQAMQAVRQFEPQPVRQCPFLQLAHVPNAETFDECPLRTAHRTIVSQVKSQPASMPPAQPLRNRAHKKRKLQPVEVVGSGSDDDLKGLDSAHCPEVGVRATATVRISRVLFGGVREPHLHALMAREMMLRAMRRIAQHRWLAPGAASPRYFVSLARDLKSPKQFEPEQAKRGRPPKHKKQRLEAEAMDSAQLKAFRLNLQMVFEHHAMPDAERVAVLRRIASDLERESLSRLLTLVLCAEVEVAETVQWHSLFAVETQRLAVFEKYDREEEARKKNKREREQKRREDKRRKSAQ